MQTFWRITLPLLRTQVTVVYVYQQAFQFLNLGYGSAMAFALFVVILALSLMQFRFFRAGGVGSPNWRSNVLSSTTDRGPSDGIVLETWLTGEDGRAVVVSEGAHQPAFAGEGTRIPTAMVAVGERLYLHTMSVHGFAQMGGVWLCNASRFVYSDDSNETWTEAQEDFGSFRDTFNMLALSSEAG